MMAAVVVFFESGKADLPADAASKFAPISDQAKTSGKKVKVSGYHDAVGNQEQNQEPAQ